MSPDHPRRVAAWLGEVFGGPKAYSEGYGGYERMVSQHLGKAFMSSAPAGSSCSPSPPTTQCSPPTRWRAAFVAYLEWGSRGLGRGTPSPRPAAAAHAGAALVVGLRRATPSRRASALAAEEPENRSTFPAPTSLSVSSSTSSRCSASVTGSRCVSRSTSGRTPTSASADAILDRLPCRDDALRRGLAKSEVEVFKRWLDSGKAA